MAYHPEIPTGQGIKYGSQRLLMQTQRPGISRGVLTDSQPSSGPAESEDT